MAVTVLLTKSLGALLTFSLYAIPTLVGLFIQWRRKHMLKRACAKLSIVNKSNDPYRKARMMSRPEFAAAETEFVTYWISVVLLAIPGLITAATAFALMLPFVKRQFTLGTQRGNKELAKKMKP